MKKFVNQTQHIPHKTTKVLQKIFMVILSIIAQIWKQLKCMYTTEWLKNMLHILKMENYLTIENSRILTWMNNEIITVSERSQSGTIMWLHLFKKL
jgi:hypothetical protein